MWLFLTLTALVLVVVAACLVYDQYVNILHNQTYAEWELKQYGRPSDFETNLA
jgi:succinate dehydrogenase hydrophobic anchor subunit